MMTYFMIGLAFLMILDFALHHSAPEDGQFTNLERILVLVAWPVFLIGLIFKHFKHNQK